MNVRRIALPANLSSVSVPVSGNFFALDIESGVIPILIAPTYTSPGTMPNVTPEAYIDDSPEPISIPLGCIVRRELGNRMIITTPYAARTAPNRGAQTIYLYYGTLDKNERFVLPQHRWSYDYTFDAAYSFLAGGAEVIFAPQVKDHLKLAAFARGLTTLYFETGGVAVSANAFTVRLYPATDELTPIESAVVSTVFSSSFVTGYRVGGVGVANNSLGAISARMHLTGIIT